MKPPLTIEHLCQQAAHFALTQSRHAEPRLFGVTDGKAVGTYLEQRFQAYLEAHHLLTVGSAARGIDFPDLNIDLKVTSITQPQSSSPFRSARQKVYGLGHGLLLFVYSKRDDMATQTATLEIVHVALIDAACTGDYQTTTGLRALLANGANSDDITAFLLDRHLPLDEVQAAQLAEEIMLDPPPVGYLTISNALQWRLQYRRMIDLAGSVAGIRKIA